MPGAQVVLLERMAPPPFPVKSCRILLLAWQSSNFQNAVGPTGSGSGPPPPPEPPLELELALTLEPGGGGGPPALVLLVTPPVTPLALPVPGAPPTPLSSARA